MYGTLLNPSPQQKQQFISLFLMLINLLILQILTHLAFKLILLDFPTSFLKPSNCTHVPVDAESVLADFINPLAMKISNDKSGEALL